MIIAKFGGKAPDLTGPQGACPINRSPFVSPREVPGVNPTAAALQAQGVVL